jgi:hypothetical protein
MLDDDAAEKEVLGWMDNADAFAKAGGGKASPTLNLKIQQRLDGIKKEYEDFIELHPKHVNARLAFGSFLNDNNDDDGALNAMGHRPPIGPDQSGGLGQSGQLLRLWSSRPGQEGLRVLRQGHRVEPARRFITTIWP